MPTNIIYAFGSIKNENFLFLFFLEINPKFWKIIFLNFDFCMVACFQHGTKSQSNPTCFNKKFIVCRLQGPAKVLTYALIYPVSLSCKHRWKMLCTHFLLESLNMWEHHLEFWWCNCSNHGMWCWGSFGTVRRLLVVSLWSVPVDRNQTFNSSNLILSSSLNISAPAGIKILQFDAWDRLRKSQDPWSEPFVTIFVDLSLR